MRFCFLSVYFRTRRTKIHGVRLWPTLVCTLDVPKVTHNTAAHFASKLTYTILHRTFCVRDISIHANVIPDDTEISEILFDLKYTGFDFICMGSVALRKRQTERFV